MHIRLNLLRNLVRSQSETLPAHLLEDPSAWEGDRYVMYCSASGSSGCSGEGLVPRPPPASSADPTTPAMSLSPSAGVPSPSQSHSGGVCHRDPLPLFPGPWVLAVVAHTWQWVPVLPHCHSAPACSSMHHRAAQPCPGTNLGWK